MCNLENQSKGTAIFKLCLSKVECVITDSNLLSRSSYLESNQRENTHKNCEAVKLEWMPSRCEILTVYTLNNR